MQTNIAPCRRFYKGQPLSPLRRPHFLLITASLLLSSCSPSISRQSELALGTVCTITIYGKAPKQAYTKAFNRLREIENRMSANMTDTEIAEVNAKAGIEAVRVDEDVFYVVEKSLHYAQISAGAFDPTIGPLVKLWGIGPDAEGRVPAQADIDAALPLIGYRDVEAGGDTIFLKRAGMALDLGAIAKGYAADEAARILKDNGVKRAIIDLGGNIYVLGERSGKKKWRVGVQNPYGERGSSAGVAEITGDTSLVTSGVYERFIEVDGKRYHHILSAKDGYPVQNGLLSVTIIAKSSIDADGLSTAVFALGYEKGRALVESLGGVEAIFIFDDNTVSGTEGALEVFSIIDERFKLKP
jgi:thiamine biosynthesis lipoprotein